MGARIPSAELCHSVVAPRASASHITGRLCARAARYSSSSGLSAARLSAGATQLDSLSPSVDS